MFMHVCVHLAKLMDRAEKILQLQVNSSCSARGIIAMPPRCGSASGEIFIQTLIFVQFCYQHMISMSLSPPHCGSASVQEFYRKFFANKSISVSSLSHISVPQATLPMCSVQSILYKVFHQQINMNVILTEKSLCRTLEIDNAISLRHFIGFKLRFILAMKLRSQFGIINHP